jgi:hypothetical protein
MGIAYMVLSLGLFARGPEPAPVESPAAGPDGPESADRQPQRGQEARDTGEERI